MVGDAYSQLPLPNYKLGFAESNTMTSHAVNTPEAMAAIKQGPYYFITVQRRGHLTARVADLVVPAPEVHEGDYAPSGSGPGPIVAANGFGTAGFVKWNVRYATGRGHAVSLVPYPGRKSTWSRSTGQYILREIRRQLGSDGDGHERCCVFHI